MSCFSFWVVSVDTRILLYETKDLTSVFSDMSQVDLQRRRLTKEPRTPGWIPPFVLVQAHVPPGAISKDRCVDFPEARFPKRLRAGTNTLFEPGDLFLEFFEQLHT